MTHDPSIQSQLLGMVFFAALLVILACAWSAAAVELRWRRRTRRWPFGGRR